MPTTPVGKYDPQLRLWEGRYVTDGRCDGTLSELVQYIMDRHHGYLKAELPRLESLLMKTAAVPCERYGAMLHTLRRMFQRFKTELEVHLQKEETVLFPAVIRMVRANGRVGQPPGPFGTFSNIIRTMQCEHDGVIETLEEIRELTAGYAIPDGAGEALKCLIEGFGALDADLRFHLELENNMLFPSIERLAGKGDAPWT